MSSKPISPVTAKASPFTVLVTLPFVAALVAGLGFLAIYVPIAGAEFLESTNIVLVLIYSVMLVVFIYITFATTYTSTVFGIFFPYAGVSEKGLEIPGVNDGQLIPWGKVEKIQTEANATRTVNSARIVSVSISQDLSYTLLRRLFEFFMGNRLAKRKITIPFPAGEFNALTLVQINDVLGKLGASFTQRDESDPRPEETKVFRTAESQKVSILLLGVALFMSFYALVVFGSKSLEAFLTMFGIAATFTAIVIWTISTAIYKVAIARDGLHFKRTFTREKVEWDKLLYAETFYVRHKYGSSKMLVMHYLAGSDVRTATINVSLKPIKEEYILAIKRQAALSN